MVLNSVRPDTDKGYSRILRFITKKWFGRRRTFDYGFEALVRTEQICRFYSRNTRQLLADATLGWDNFDLSLTEIARRDLDCLIADLQVHRNTLS